MNLNTSNILQRNTKRKWGLIILLSSLIIISVIGYLNKDWLYTGYYYIFKYDHFEKGDTMYIDIDYFKDPNSNAVVLYKLARPLNNSEIDQLPSIDNSEKALIKLRLLNAKTLLTSTRIAILKEDLIANNTYKIGTYIQKDMANILMTDANGNQVTTYSLFYSIKPDKQVTYTDPKPYNIDMPKYYTWADSTLYVLPFNVSSKGQ